MKNNIVRRIAYIALAIIFSVAAIAKLNSLQQFESVLFNSGFVPYFALKPAAFAVITCEVMLSVVLVIPKLSNYGARSTIVLCSVFLAYSIWRAINRIAVPCECFGVLYRMSPLQSIVLNLVMIGVALWLSTKETIIRDVHEVAPL
jgi:uncharacterized membrane protein YphA (DoxX/SURF4 family)